MTDRSDPSDGAGTTDNRGEEHGNEARVQGFQQERLSLQKTWLKSNWHQPTSAEIRAHDHRDPEQPRLKRYASRRQAIQEQDRQVSRDMRRAQAFIAVLIAATGLLLMAVRL